MIKELKDYSFDEFMTLSKEDFDELMSKDTSTIGYLSGLRVLLTSQHGELVKMAIELYNKAETLVGEESEKAYNTAEGLKEYLILLEYKVTCIVSKIKSLSEV